MRPTNHRPGGLASRPHSTGLTLSARVAGFQPVAAGLLPAGVEINLQLMITSTQSVMGVYLHPRVVRALSELGGGIDMSIVAVSERPPG